MKNDIEFLKKAIALADGSEEQIKCGVLIVQDNEIVSAAFNSQRVDRQAVNHAEIKALQVANRHLNSRTLQGVTVYCSCEPCVMCLTALSLAKVDRIVYAKTMKELFPEDPMAQIDTTSFAKQLNFVPKIQHLVVS